MDNDARTASKADWTSLPLCLSASLLPLPFYSTLADEQNWPQLIENKGSAPVLLDTKTRGVASVCRVSRYKAPGRTRRERPRRYIET